MAQVFDFILLIKRFALQGAFPLERLWRSMVGLCLAICPVLASAALVAEYRFEETSYNGTANEVADSSGNGRHGKMVGTVTSSSAGKICRGIQIPKNTTSAIQAFDTGLDVNTIGNVGSISFWYKSVTSGNEHRMMFDATTASSGKFYLYRDDDDDGVDLNFYAAENGGGTKQVDETDVLTDAVWGHVVVTWDAPGGKLRIYTNGALRDTLSSSFSGGALSAAIDTLYFGDNRYASSAEVNSANGFFDQIRIYNHELTQAQVTADMNAAPTCNTLHHLEVTSVAASGVAGASVTFTIKACANAACSTTYTGGVTGNLAITGSGMTITYPSGAAFTIASGAATTTVAATMSPAGASTVGLSSVAPVSSGSPAVYCGIGVAASSSGNCTYTTTAASTLHHLELTSPASTAVTCAPIVYTVRACANADCSALNTAGLTGTLSVTGTTVGYPSGAGFTIANGSSSTTVSAHASTVGTATAALTGLSATPTFTPKVFCGTGAGVPANGTGSCAVTVAESALLFDVPNHVSDVQQSITVRALKSSSDPTVCTAAYTGSKAVKFKCSYANPGNGTLPVRVGGVALNAANNASAKCDAAGRDVSLTFDGNGQASAAIQYADVGQMVLSASSTSDMALSGGDTFIAVPSSFGFSTVTSPITAGAAFTTIVTARNASGATTPNFGNETASSVSLALSWLRYRPTGGLAANGVFSGTGISTALTGFSNGARTVTDLSWSEVGSGDLTATMSADYLGAGVKPAGTTGSTGTAGAVGRFIPARLGVAVTQACGGLFTYSGQPFTATVTALNAAGVKTVNYDGTGAMTPSHAKAVTLSTTTPGTFGNNLIAASAFSAGVATVATPTFAFDAKLTEATSVSVQGTDADGVSSTAGTAGVLKLRSGRLKTSNFFGSERSEIELPVQAQYWTGRAWVLNEQDSCTLLPTSAVALSNYRNSKGGAAPGWTTSAVSSLPINAGHGKIRFSAPTSGGTGSVDMALNLGSTNIDQSCLSAHPASTGGASAWMRSQYGSSGSCASMWDRDPSARITFGVYAPESRKTIYGREAF